MPYHFFEKTSSPSATLGEEILLFEQKSSSPSATLGEEIRKKIKILFPECPIQSTRGRAFPIF
jgi:hypothetical protein